MPPKRNTSVDLQPILDRLDAIDARLGGIEQRLVELDVQIADLEVRMAAYLIMCGPPAYGPSVGTWFVRPVGGSYGAEDGTSHADAWNGFANIDWNVLGAGDTLWLSGTFTNSLQVQSTGSGAYPLWIRGDYELGAGIMSGADILWDDAAANYITIYGVTLNEGRIAYKEVAAYRDGTNLVFTAPDTIQDTDKGFISSGLLPGQIVQMAGGDAANRWTYLIKSITDEGGYEELKIETEENLHPFVSEGPTSKVLEAYWPNHHITVDNCYIQSTFFRVLVEFKGTDFTVRNSELDGTTTESRGGILYVSNRNFWKLHSNIIIEENYLHGGGTDMTSDEHGIGVQGVDGLLITKNRIADCGSGIVMWHGSTTPIKNYEITYNLIEGMDYNVKPDGWGGSGIVYTGSSEPPDLTTGLVAGNVLRNPLNCPQGGANEWGACLGIRNKISEVMSIHNNLIMDHDYGILVEGFVAADVKNNIVTGSGLHHVASNPPGTSYEEDYSIYNTDSATSFKYVSTESNFADYNSGHSETVNVNSVIADPELGADFKPTSSDSPAVNNGVDVGYTYLVSATWPTARGGGSFAFAIDAVDPDIGPFKFVG